MTHKEIDKLMKPYWDEKFKNSYLGDFYAKDTGWTDDWYGILMKRPDGNEKLVVGHMSGDNDGDNWFYDGSMFKGGRNLFSLNMRDFNFSMVRYINEKYNLEVKSVL